jgi:hypothetical protein
MNLIYFARDFDGYIDNLLTPEKRATSPSSSDIINGFSLKDDNHASNLPIQLIEQVKIVQSMLRIERLAH